jgi:hypothetical protein
VAGVLGVAALVAGCGSATAPSARPVAPQPGPAGLVGIWRVTGTDEPEGTRLRLSMTDLSLWRPCGVTFGSWRADAQTFVADSSSATGNCPSATEPPAWLRDSVRYRPDRAGWRLVDASGRVLAGLVPSGSIAPRADVDTSLSAPPRLGDPATSFPEPAPLPTRLHPVTASALAGRWVPQGARPAAGQAFLQLAANGVWRASDGCNVSSGRWALGYGSRVLATSGPSTEIGCDNVDVGGWWSRAARAGTDGQYLVLTDPMGEVLATLTRTPPGPLMTHGPAPSR